ncbi:MAG TPA: transporter [Epsilonproteobacteria bacterium]|nr:transporter [Campylobacterota bacterium]
MIETLLSILFIYLFIILGYLAKAIYKDQVDSRTLTIMSVYFLQPFVTVWGFSTARLEIGHFYVSLVYLGIILLILIPTMMFGKLFFRDAKERAIFSVAGFVGNTGNIGIPLGIALLGVESVIYTTLINIANVLVVYTIGVYVYSRGSFSIRGSLLNIVKIPIIPAAMAAILMNLAHVEMTGEILEFLKMGAYAGIVLQLFLLGTFLETVRIRELHPYLMLSVLGQKFVIVPFATAFILSLTTLPLFVQAVLFMEMMVPLAVANLNLSSLYDCRPKEVTTLILLSTLLFIPMLFVLSTVLTTYYAL